ncbi:Ubiquitin-conjugating enzyme E2 J2 [Blattella germanica]|nr:Ubiquitin-conjugating enzyme E2 J2 [Blattella germanica]
MTTRKTNSATARLKQDYLRLKKDPVPYVVAEPLPSNILEWHYVVTGPENTPYDGGLYHGKLVFPQEFPFKPPSIYMITPNGRFKTNTRLCLSISDFHPDTWNPAWSVSTILTGLLSFMLMKTELERIAEAERAARSNPQSVTSNDMQALLRNQFGHNDQGPLHSAITNICVIIGFAAFAYTVKYVLRSIATE